MPWYFWLTVAILGYLACWIVMARFTYIRHKPNSDRVLDSMWAGGFWWVAIFVYLFIAITWLISRPTKVERAAAAAQVKLRQQKAAAKLAKELDLPTPGVD